MSRQGFGGDDDDDRSDVERLLDGFTSARDWYERNKDIFEKFSQKSNNVDLAGGEPISEAHVDSDKVLIVADVSGVNATDLELSFYDGKVEGRFGERDFKVSVPNDVDEDSAQADMKNGVLRVKLQREDNDPESVSVDTVDKEELGDNEKESTVAEENFGGEEEVDLEELFGEDGIDEDNAEGGDT